MEVLNQRWSRKINRARQTFARKKETSRGDKKLIGSRWKRKKGRSCDEKRRDIFDTVWRVSRFPFGSHGNHIATGGNVRPRP